MGIRGISWGYDGNINHTNKNDMDMIWVNVSNLPTRSQCYSVGYRENHPKWPISDLRLVYQLLGGDGGEVAKFE